MSRLDYPIEWSIGSRSLTLNGHRTADGGIDRGNLSRTFLVESFDFSPLDIREQREGMHLLTGGDFGMATRQFRHISLRGAIKAPSDAALEDMEAEFLAAFDIEHALRDAPATMGLGSLIYRTPTDISVPGVGKLIREGFICRPESYPITFERRGPRGLIRRWAVQLVSGYPYRLLYPEQSVVFSAADGWTQELPNWTARHGGTSRLSLLIDMGGAGANNFTVSDGTRSLVLDLSSTTSDWNIVVEMWSKQVYRVNGTKLADKRTSGIDTFFDVPPGGCTVAVTNRTNVTSVTATYQQSRA